jgi:large subunit ribosomal protein L10
MARPDKVAVVEEVRDKLRDADAAVLTEYRGLTVAELAQLRGTLRPSSTEYKVFKNSLARRAAEAAGLADLLPYLEGPVAIAFVHGDAVIAAKALRDFGRTNPALVIKGGLLGPRVLSGADVEILAEIEPRDVLLARLAGGFQAPLTKAAGLFQAFTRNLAYGVQAYIDQRVAAGEPAPTPTVPDTEGPETTVPETTVPETTGADAAPPPAPDEAASPAAAVDEAPSADADTNESETQDPATPDDAESEEN